MLKRELDNDAGPIYYLVTVGASGIPVSALTRQTFSMRLKDSKGF